MLKWIRDKYDDWKFEKEFQAKKKEIMKIDPFIYDLPNTNEFNIGGVVKNDDSKNYKRITNIF